MTVDNELIGLRLKQSAKVVCEKDEYYFSCDAQKSKVKNNYIPIARILMSKSGVTVEFAEKVLEESGMTEFSAEFAVGQFLVDYANYIE